jgi:hypothetical protein
MIIQYQLRGKRQDESIEREGSLTEEQLADSSMNQDTARINAAIRELHKQGTIAEWQECTLKNVTTQEEKIYVRYKKRWTQRKQIPSQG